MFRKSTLTTILAGLAAITTSQATVIWTENFSAYSATDSVDGLATATGTGTFATAADVVVNASGGLTFTASASRTQLAVTTGGTNAMAGYFAFDFASSGTNDTLFLQLVDGTDRSTGGNPQPSFAYTIKASDLGISTSLVTVTLFFNATASSITYTAPDSTTESLAAGSFDVWAGTTRYSNDNTNPNNATVGVPTTGGVDSLFLQTFIGQDGAVFEFDNMSFGTLPVPEPGSVTLLGLSLAALLARRRR